MIASIKLNSKDFLEGASTNSFVVYAYIFADNIMSVYTNIRQKAIDKLMKI